MNRRSDDDWKIQYLLDLDRQKVRLESGYWWTVRAYRVEPSAGRPHGLGYSISLHDQNDDRVFGFDNAHGVDVGTGPARKSRRPKAYDHKHVRGKESVPYTFTSPAQLIEDFFEAMNEYLEKEGLS